jgi:hypothetical protein
MNKIILLDDVRIVYWAETIQGRAEVDGEEVVFRYSEDSNGPDFWVFDGKNWVAADTSQEQTLYEICCELQINKDSKSGDEFEWEYYE